MADEVKEIAFIGLDEKGFPFVREPIKISLSSYKNSKYLDIRKYYEKDGEWFPTTKGITIKHDLFDKLIEVLQTNSDEIKKWIQDK